MKNQTEYNYPLNFIDSQAIFQSDIQITGPNNAEIDAMIQERNKLLKEKEEQIIYQSNMKKYKNNIRKYKEKEIKDNLKMKEIEKEKLEKKKEKDMYNTQVREKNNVLFNHTRNKSKENKIEKNNIVESNINKISKKNSTNEERVNNNSSKDNNDIKKEAIDTISNDELNNINTDKKEKKNPLIVDLSRGIKEEIKKYIIPQQKNELIKQLLNKEKGNEIINDEIASNLKMIENFRQKGTIEIPYSNTPYTPSALSTDNRNTNYARKSYSKGYTNNNTKFKSEFEKRRFIKALKHIMTERLGEKNIIIPNICSCGQLQKKLDALIEVGNISVLTYGDLECANNCIYYKNPEEYTKNINDVLKSIKSLTYKAFNNKYKN